MLARLLSLAVLALVAVSCGAVPPTPVGTAVSETRTALPPTPTVASLPTQTTASGARALDQCTATQPRMQFARSAPSSRNLALVSLNWSKDWVVRDITDMNHSFTVSSVGSQIGYLAQFVNATELSDRDGNLNLVRMPLSGSPRTVFAQCVHGLFAWSPDGTTAAYVTVLEKSSGNRTDQFGSELHLVTAGGNRVVSTMPPFWWDGGCDGSCADSMDLRLLYSPDGAYISLVQTMGGPSLRVWASSGKVLASTDDASPLTMSLWSGNSLYFRDGKGVQRWRDGTESLVLPGVAWMRPKASPGGGQIVFAQRAANDEYGQPSVFMFDTAAGTTRLIAKSRNDPAFLTSRYIWYRGQRPCVAGDPYQCHGEAPWFATGKAYIYDLQTGTESESIITSVLDVWPHPA